MGCVVLCYGQGILISLSPYILSQSLTLTPVLQLRNYYPTQSPNYAKVCVMEEGPIMESCNHNPV